MPSAQACAYCARVHVEQVLCMANMACCQVQPSSVTDCQGSRPMSQAHPPTQALTTTCRAMCHLKLQQPRPAAQLAAEVLYHTPDHARALYLLGSARMALRQYGPAAEALRRASQAAPGDGLVAGQLRRAVELGRREKQRRMRAMVAG